MTNLTTEVPVQSIEEETRGETYLATLEDLAPLKDVLDSNNEKACMRTETDSQVTRALGGINVIMFYLPTRKEAVVYVGRDRPDVDERPSDFLEKKVGKGEVVVMTNDRYILKVGKAFYVNDEEDAEAGVEQQPPRVLAEFVTRVVAMAERENFTGQVLEQVRRSTRERRHKEIIEEKRIKDERRAQGPYRPPTRRQIRAELPRMDEEHAQEDSAATSEQE